MSPGPKNRYKSPDARTKAARAQGYPARSVFKLMEIDRRVRLFKPGQHVLDLGAAPGSWSLYASQRVQSSGRVVAVDRTPISQKFEPNVSLLEEDVFSLDPEKLTQFAPYDVVLSDMAPNTSGAKASDQAQSFELVSQALAIAERFGKPGSAFVAKLLLGPDFEQARQAILRVYRGFRVIRPKGTRPNSSEVFLAGTNKR